MEARGGKCIAIQCDHSKDEDIERVFEKIQSDENGCLDIVVNNAYSGIKVRYRHWHAFPVADPEFP